MEQLPTTTTKVATKWALIYVLTAIVITYVIEITKVDPNSSIKYLGYIPLVAFLFLAQKEYKDHFGGYIKFGDAFSVGFKYGLFSGLLFAVFLYVYLAFLSPEVLANSVESQRSAMAAKGLSSEQVDNAVEIAKKYGAIFGAVGVVLVYTVMGVIFGLIGAAIFKKERSAFDPEPSTSDPIV